MWELPVSSSRLRRPRSSQPRRARADARAQARRRRKKKGSSFRGVKFSWRQVFVASPIVGSPWNRGVTDIRDVAGPSYSPVTSQLPPSYPVTDKLPSYRPVTQLPPPAATPVSHQATPGGDVTWESGAR